MPTFDEALAELFRTKFGTVFRYLDRLSGDPDLAQDLAQEAFVRLHQRGTMPEDGAAWLAKVATNLFHDTKRMARRRKTLLTTYRADAALASAAAAPDAVLPARESQERVRAVLATLSVRDQQLLLLRHEGYSYRELAIAVGVAEASVGTFLLRATRAFKTALHQHSSEDPDAWHSTLA